MTTTIGDMLLFAVTTLQGHIDIAVFTVRNSKQMLDLVYNILFK